MGKFATGLGLLFFGVLATALAVSWPTNSKAAIKPGEEMSTTTALGLSLLGVKEATPDGDVAKLEKSTAPTAKRKKIGYLLPFEIVSVHLLVVLVGAAYLARTKRRRGGHAHA